MYTLEKEWYISLLVVLSLLTLVAQAQQQFVLNITAYSSYFATNCPSSPPPSYPPSCDPFSETTLWIPNGIPNFNSTVNVTGDSQVILVVPNTKSYQLDKLSLNGAVQVIVEGILNFTFASRSNVFTNLVVCDTSEFVVRNNGYVYSYMTSFFDTSSLIVQDNAILYLDMITANGSFVSFSLRGNSNSVLGNVRGTVQSLKVEGNGAVLSYFSLNLQSLYVADSAFVQTGVYVYSNATLQGLNYYLKFLIASSNAVVTINGCPNIDSIFVYDTSYVTLYTTTNVSVCTVRALIVASNGVANIVGDIDFLLQMFTQYYPYGNGLLSFNHITPGVITNVVLPSSTGPAFVSFTGNYNVKAGEIDNRYNIPMPFNIHGIAVTGHVNLEVVQVQLDPGFEFVPGLNLTLPANGTLFIKNTFQLNEPQFNWLPHGTVVVDDFGSAVADSFELTQGRTLVLDNYYDTGATLQVNKLVIGAGSILRAEGFSSSFFGSMQVEGFLNFEPTNNAGAANMTIYGNLTIAKSGTVSLPQTLELDVLFPSSWTFLRVIGQVHLGGNLNVTLGGKFPEGFSAQNYTIDDIPLMTATNILLDFDKFEKSLTSSLEIIANNEIELNYRIENNTVFLQVQRPEVAHSQIMWFVVGGVVGISLIILAVLIALLIMKRQSEYKQIQEDSPLTTLS